MTIIGTVSTKHRQLLLLSLLLIRVVPYPLLYFGNMTESTAYVSSSFFALHMPLLKVRLVDMTKSAVRLRTPPDPTTSPVGPPATAYLQASCQCFYGRGITRLCVRGSVCVWGGGGAGGGSSLVKLDALITRVVLNSCFSDTVFVTVFYNR